tara:strand:+ start:2507 stop:2794 length:288 start_codon:yes stop_codon:yes gene_type:complete
MIKYNYQSDYSNVVTILDNKKRTIFNALCITSTIEHACLETGVSERAMFAFMNKYSVTHNEVKAMRIEFKESNKKVKLQFKKVTNGKNTHYCKNS